MKQLTKIRLVNWYHIGDETLPIHGSALFMGDNGSGKSTVLDALQFALVADLAQVRFNQAANESAERSLQGYTRWMVNSEGTKDTHVYNRGDCTSYILLEFQEAEASFVIGAVVDSYRDGRDPNRLHFVMNDAKLAQIPVLEDDGQTPMLMGQFSRLMRARKGFFYSREPGTYRDEMLIRLGRLSPDFTKLLVKAQAFKPLGKVQQFVMDFLLDPKPLDTRSLQENLSSYKALEQKAIDAEKRVDHLSRIMERADELERAVREIHQFRFLELRAHVGIQEKLLSEQSLKAQEQHQYLAEARASDAKLHATFVVLQAEHGSVLRALSESGTFAERERAREDIRRAEANLKISRADLENIASARRRIGQVVAEIKALGLPLTPKADIPMSEIQFQARKTASELTSELERLKTAAAEAQGRLRDLKKGIRPIPPAARALKQLLQDELRCKTAFLCELIEVEDERWQDAVEGYLNTRRFDIILDPKYFNRALSIYDTAKRRLSLQGVGLVDCEKVVRAASGVKPGALAELVSSDNANAKSYVNFLLGELICCDSEQDLRKFDRSITPTCMVYQNHAARQTAFDVFASWFIGSRGQARLMEQTEAEINRLANEFQRLAEDLERWGAAQRLSAEGESLESQIAREPELRSGLEALKLELERLQNHLQSLNDPELLKLEATRDRLAKELDEMARELRVSAHTLGMREAELNSLEASIAQTQHLLGREQDQLLQEFGPERFSPEELADYEKYYGEQLEKRPSPEDIVRIYETQRKNRETKRENISQQMTALRADYNNIFGYSGPTVGEDISTYRREQENWRESRLADYQERIKAAKELALQQLMEDVVHKLRENLDLVPEQFEQINRALRGFQFGHDQYQFTYKIKPEFEPFERLIREAAQYENQPLFETDWRTRFRQGGGLEALFENLIHGSSHQVEHELAQYSDYREYYEYDLKITGPNNVVSFFSRVNKWKSGGETQTPYYIAVIASLYRLYRLPGSVSAGRSSPSLGRGTIGLVILDEAFNKMDEDHLKATLEFTRRLGLQLIMATPKERADFIIPHVESTWLVAKDPASGQGFLQDFHQRLEPLTSQAIPEATI